MIFKILDDDAPTYLNNIITLNKDNTRSFHKLVVNKPPNITENGGATLWNKFPEDIRNRGSVKAFNLKLEPYSLNKQ